MATDPPDNIATLEKIKIANKNRSATEDFDSFVNSVNLDIEHINTLINTYNQADNSKKLEVLIEINTYRLVMNNKYRLEHIANCESYQDQIHKKLYDIIQNKLKVHSQLPASEQRAIQLTKLIKNMLNDDMSNVMSILWQNKSDRSSSLKAMNVMNVFFRSHEFAPMTQGMKENSRNIKINTRTGDRTPFLLKLDCRLGQPRSAEMALRKDNVKYLSNIYGETRQGTFNAPDGDKIAANFVVTDFYNNGDLENQAIKNFKLSSTEKQSRACHLYLNMAGIMQDMLDKKVAFPDAKNSNWLIDNEGELIIGDTKSFAHINESGELDYSNEENRWIEIIYSDSHNPVEFEDLTHPFSVDKMNSYMLGKNIYQYLTGCNWEKLGLMKELSEQDFEDEVFKDAMGHELKELIQNMLQSDPKDRPTLKSAQETLKWLVDINKLPEEERKIRLECKNIIQDIDRMQLPYQRVIYTEVEDGKLQLKSSESQLDKMTEFKKTLQNLVTGDNTKLLRENYNTLQEHLRNSSLFKEQKKILLDIQSSQDNLLNKYSKLTDLYNFHSGYVRFQCEKKLKALEQLGLNFQNDNYINEITDKLKKKDISLPELDELKRELTKIVDITKDVSSTIKNFESTWFLYKDADTKKAKNIKTTFEAIPLKARAHIFDSDKNEYPSIIAFKKALATHRIGSTDEKNEAFFDKKTKLIHSEKAAATYKKFKEKFEEIKNENKNKTPASHDGEEKPSELKKPDYK